MSKGCNWHELKTVLEGLGFIQDDYYLDTDLLFFRRKEDGKTIGFYRSNKFENPYLLGILRKLGITYEEFENLYKKFYGNTLTI